MGLRLLRSLRFIGFQETLCRGPFLTLPLALFIKGTLLRGSISPRFPLILTAQAGGLQQGLGLQGSREDSCVQAPRCEPKHLSLSIDFWDTFCLPFTRFPRVLFFKTK